MRLYEKRSEYTRTRMVRLAEYLVADSVESYCADHIDGDNVEAVFDRHELDEGVAFRQTIPSDLMALLSKWALGFCPLNTIERSLSDLIDTRESNAVHRNAAVVTAEDAMAMLEPGDILIDCTGARSLLRDDLAPGSGEVDGDANTFTFMFEHVLVITFLYGQTYACNEYCKYYKNVENPHYKFIPMVHRTFNDGHMSHVTGIVNISAEDFEAMPNHFDGQWLRNNFPGVAESMDRFIDKIKQETHGEILGDLEIIRIPLNLYRARNATSREWHTAGTSTTRSPARRCSCSAIRPSALPTFSRSRSGSSVRCSWRDSSRSVTCHSKTCSTYELYIYKQWLRVYMQSKMIKHNKDLFESLDDPLALWRSCTFIKGW